MNNEQIFTTLSAHGVRLTRGPDGALRAGPAAAVTAELAALIRAHRAALLAALAPPPDPQAVREFFDERAAVFEYEAGLPRAEAEAGALRRTLARFGLPDPGDGGIDAVVASLNA
ncbi:MAG: hypothetical protein ACOY6E_09215 [Pseudomonadota bacterium]